MNFPGRMCRIPVTPLPFKNAHLGVDRKTAHRNESGTRPFIASLFILGTGFGCVKARAANRRALTFWRCAWLLPSLIDFTDLTTISERAGSTHHDPGNLFAELVETTMRHV